MYPKALYRVSVKALVKDGNSAITLAKSAIIHPELSYFQANLEDDFSNIEAVSKSSYSLITMKLVFASIANKEVFVNTAVTLLAPGRVFVIITADIRTTPAEKRDIAVDCDETLALLEKTFTSVEVFYLPTSFASSHYIPRNSTCILPDLALP